MDQSAKLHALHQTIARGEVDKQVATVTRVTSEVPVMVIVYPQTSVNTTVEGLEMEAIEMEAIVMEALEMEALEMEAIEMEAIEMEALEMEALDVGSAKNRYLAEICVSRAALTAYQRSRALRTVEVDAVEDDFDFDNIIFLLDVQSCLVAIAKTCH